MSFLHVLLQAWDIEDATLEIIAPEISMKVLANHREEPLCVANRCAPTPDGGVTAEVITEEEMKKQKNIKGKIVFTKFHPKKIRKDVIEKNGIGMISCYSGAPLDVPDSTWWINGWGSPGWYLTEEDKKIFCFSITPRRGWNIPRRWSRY